MTIFEAEYNKVFAGAGDYLITAKEWIAYQINNNWIYSTYWDNKNWVSQAKKDCLHRIGNVKADLRSLEKALAMLDSIEESK